MRPDIIKTLRSVSVTLSREELASIIKCHLEREGFEVKDVDFRVTSRIEGYGMDRFVLGTLGVGHRWLCLGLLCN